MKNNLLRTGYVMVSRALLMEVYEKQGEASCNEEAFLRVLTHVNYKSTTVCINGAEVCCARGESVITFLLGRDSGLEQDAYPPLLPALF